MIYLLAFLASLAHVFFKAFQQRNVAFDHYRWVMPTSLCMTFTEFYVIALFVMEGFDLLLVGAIGAGAGLGAIIAMHLHGKYLGSKDPVDSGVIMSDDLGGT